MNQGRLLDGPGESWAPAAALVSLRGRNLQLDRSNKQMTEAGRASNASASSFTSRVAANTNGGRQGGKKGGREGGREGRIRGD
ncbi:hypothetical protein E2C01_082804 [Portunus trituberculatus]|uniref:Uncharacterized protein n=1 Tax=Portunus trituberculatus TaxID=210409 RepID=A0A5B7J097_PORTR|nr:hypothetical protein [Portunus trituberculatus]